MIRPSLVIPRIRAECPIFQGRVAGAATMRKALTSDDFPVPHAFIVPLADNDDGTLIFSDLQQEIPARLGVVVVVENLSDDPGKAAAERLMDARDQLHRALIGWQPAEEFDGLIYTGMADDPDLTRARCWAQFNFTSTVLTAS